MTGPRQNPREFTREAFRFFLDHAGYATPPGRVQCAANYAKAERTAQERGWTIDWQWDDDPDISWMDEREQQEEHDIEAAVLFDQYHQIRASLCGIVDPDHNYRRVIAAELAIEVLYSEWQTEAQYDAFLARVAVQS